MKIPARLIIVNAAIYTVMKILWLCIPSMSLTMESVVEALALPSATDGVIHAPWTVATYMFTHLDFWHLLVNSLWLAWFGTLLAEIAGGRQVACTYMAGGIGGASLYVAFTSEFFPGSDTYLVGASAATFAVITAAIVSEPGKRVRMAFIGTFALRKLAIAGAVVFLLASLDMTPSQTAAHLGGILTGAIWAAVWRIYNRRNMRVMQQRTRYRFKRMELVEKARLSGYSSLTDAEKLRLFDMSVKRHDSELI